MAWVRLWEDMPTDPKWRVIAKRSGRSIAEAMAVFNFMLVAASKANGNLDAWSDEDVAAALDMEPEHVEAIRNAMQGKVLTGDRLSAWEVRQPKREDDSLQRVRAHRERQRDAVKRDVTQCNAVETQRNAPDTDTDTDTDTEPDREDTPRDAIADEFDGQFWPAYPLRKAKGAALKAYRSARKRTTLTVILTALDKQRSVFAEPKYSPHATTWLNGDRWLDEIIEGAGNGPKPTKFDNMLAGVLAAAGGGDAGETVEPLPAGSQITGSLENADGRLLGAPEPLSGRRH
jgi:acyl dehydratase